MLIFGDANGIIRIFNLSNVIEKHSAYNNNFVINEGSATFQTEIDYKNTEEFVIKDFDVVHIMTFRAHWSSIIDLGVDNDLRTHMDDEQIKEELAKNAKSKKGVHQGNLKKTTILTTSSQDSEVFIWDLASRVENKLYGNKELKNIGSLVIKGTNKSWMVAPDKDSKIGRQRETKNEILAKALRIKDAIHREYSVFNQVRE